MYSVDQFQRIRLVFGPSVLFFSLLVGAWANGTLDMCLLERLDGKVLAAIVAIAAAATLPVGFAIGAITILSMKFLWLFIDRRNNFQAHLSDDAWEQIFFALGSVPRPDLKNDTCGEIRSRRLYAAATFVRIRMDKQIHELLDRRYQAFNAFVGACIALVLSHFPVGWLIGITSTDTWTWITICIGVLFAGGAVSTWLEMRRLFECAARTTNERDRFSHPQV